MGETKLYSIREMIQHDITFLASFMHVEIEVVDEELTRVAGTNVNIRERVCDLRKERRVYARAIETQERQFLFNAGSDKTCSGCLHRDNCGILLKVAIPFLYDQRVIGVIGLIAKNETEKSNLQNHLSEHLELTELLMRSLSSELMSRELETEKSLLQKLLMPLMESIEANIVLLKDGFQMLHNTKAENWFLEKQVDLQNAHIEIQSSRTSSDTFRKMSINQRTYSITGKYFCFENYTIILFDRDGKDAVITPLEELTRKEILKSIELFGDTKEGKIMAAEKLGIGLATLYRKLNQYK